MLSTMFGRLMFKGFTVYRMLLTFRILHVLCATVGRVFIIICVQYYADT